jgi:uncharacterized SAM-binding protein YcdF (DUF218 family)
VTWKKFDKSHFFSFHSSTYVQKTLTILWKINSHFYIKIEKEGSGLMKIRKWVGIMVMSFLLFVFYTAGCIVAFSYQNDLTKTDAAIVLGAAVIKTKPSPVFKERIRHAIWLYKHQHVQKLIFTGGQSDGDVLAESAAAKQYALSTGIPEKDIFIETKSTITEENLFYAQRIGQRQHFDTYTIVSDPLHMKRAMLLAHDLGMQAHSSPTQTSAYESWQTKMPFLAREWFFYTGYLLTRPFRQ